MKVLLYIYLLTQPIEFKNISLIERIEIIWGINVCGKYLKKYYTNYDKLLYAIIAVESSYGKFKKGKHGEVGITQIHPINIKNNKEYNLIYKSNFYAICKTVKILLAHFKVNNNLKYVLKRYNGSIRYYYKIKKYL